MSSKWFYKIARFINDVNAVSSGKPDRMLKRIYNKIIGRLVVSKLYKR